MRDALWSGRHIYPLTPQGAFCFASYLGLIGCGHSTKLEPLYYREIRRFSSERRSSPDSWHQSNQIIMMHLELVESWKPSYPNADRSSVFCFDSVQSNFWVFR